MRLAALETEEVRGAAGLAAIEGEWRDLAARDGNATPFQSPAWLIPWWEVFAPGELAIVVARREGRLAGVAAFFVYRRTAAAPRELLLLGTGNSDYLGVTADPGEAPSVAAAVLAHLHARGGWDVCDLQRLRPDSPLLDAPLPAGLAGEVLAHEACPVLPLPRSPEALDGVLAPRLAANLRYSRRRAERLGPLAVEEADAATAGPMLDALIELHGARWNARGSGGVLSDARVAEFHRRAAPRLLREGALRLLALRIGGRTAAVFYGLADRARTYFYVAGFDPAFAGVSAGHQVVRAAVVDAIERGAREFDFLCGQEPYKFAWGARNHPTYRRVLTPTPRS